MKSLLAAALVLLASRADALTATKIKRGDLEVKIQVTGTVIADDIFRIKSTIDGRVESVLASTYTWRGADQPLAFLAHKELAAMLDSKGNQNTDILEDRWQRVYRPTPARCPDTCFILKNFLKVKTWVKPESVMFEAASSLKLVARVRPEDVTWVHDGQELTFWPLDNPKRILKGRVTRFILDIQGEKVTPGATFTLTMSPDRYFDPGTAWEGLIIPLNKRDVTYVPTAALIHAADGIYLPVRVSTGITTQGLTVLTAGAEAGKEILILDDAQLHGAERHAQTIESIVPKDRPVVHQDDEPAAIPDATPLKDKKRRKHAQVIEDNVDYGEDPYAEPQ
jgi:hypothetical protein